MPCEVWKREEVRPNPRQMTRREGWREITKICAELHESLSGTGDRLTEEEIAYDLETLRVALRNWRLPSSAYDEAHRSLISATLAEYGARQGC